MSGGIIAVTSLALEARVAQGPGVSVVCSSGSRLAAALESAVARGACGIISFGIAGGLAPALRAGDWVVAAGIRAGDQLFPTDWAWAGALLERLPSALYAEIAGVDDTVPEPADKRSLHAETGAAAVDTESHIAARIAAAHHVPFVACRTIIDSVDRPLPPAALTGVRPDGRADAAAVFRSVLQQPRQVPALTRIAFDAWIARAALGRGRRLLGSGLGFPHFNDAMAGTARSARLTLASEPS